VSEKTKLTPPLKWAGGKRWLVPLLAELYHGHHKKRFVEPFCGGMAPSLGLQPHIALLNDFNYHLINFYRQIKMHGLMRGQYPSFPWVYDKEIYYQCREQFNNLIKHNQQGTREAAQLFYYLNRTCFNGLCRFNAKGFFNVPFGQYTTVNFASSFKEYQSAFKHWTFENRDFEHIDIQSDDFIYADPPYDVVFTTYSAGGFSWNDQVRLFHWLMKHPGPVVISNQATKRIIDLYKAEFDITLLDGPRRISRTGDRTPAKEMLATRNL